ncbi:cytochrome c biogenesis protein CcdA [Candidatus Falkowbacteria bacterium]|nr:cytochrome c biogenesis protein CcdA [Candidatus Falkowbacteria bacterium]
MELFLSASIVAAFIAGMAALFAPCCITVLLPSYFASIFRERYQVFLMTFIFFLGILTVFLPLGLGAAFIGTFFSRYHNLIFAIGGVGLTFLGILLLIGKHWSLPWQVHPSLKKHNAASVYVLGVFSGVATTCCAPVLAGVLTLAALPNSIFWGLMYTLSYVLGMVAPLFVLSLFLDKINFSNKLRRAFNKPISYSLGGRQITIRVTEVVAGMTFLGMGGIILYLTATNRLFTHAGYQTTINIYLTKILSAISGGVKAIPEIIWAFIILIVIASIVYTVFKKLTKENYEEKI